MENAYKRKKQPEVIRRALLDQAARITLEQGLSKVTFQAVADAVGVTKGGVMHHFSTKNALVLEVFNDAMAKFEAEVNAAMADDPVKYGSFTRAYIDATNSKNMRQRIILKHYVWFALSLTVFGSQTFQVSISQTNSHYVIA